MEEALRARMGLRRGELMRDGNTAMDVLKAISSEQGKMGYERGLAGLNGATRNRAANDELICQS
jgi:hypothetical protein